MMITFDYDTNYTVDFEMTTVHPVHTMDAEQRQVAAD